MFSETQQNWTVVDVVLAWVLQQNLRLGGVIGENPTAGAFLPARSGPGECRAVMLSCRASLSPALRSCAVFADTRQGAGGFTLPSSRLPAGGRNRGAHREPFKSTACTRGPSHRLHPAGLCRPSVLPRIAVTCRDQGHLGMLA